jgi:hypothetical protein
MVDIYTADDRGFQMNAAQKFYQLKDLSECKWREAQDMVSLEENRQNRIRSNNHGTITKQDEAEWFRVLADAYSLQKEAIAIEKEAAEARVEMIREQYRDYDRLVDLGQELDNRQYAKAAMMEEGLP